MVALTNNTTEPVVVEREPNRPVAIKRISWGAIIAGVVIAVIVQIAMNILGLSIGAAALDPDAPRNALGPTFSTGAVVWIGVSTMISLFAGGYVASRFSGNPSRGDGMMHGLVVWAVATLFGFLMLWSTASSIISGVSSLVGEGLSLIGMSVAEAAPEVAQAVDMQDMVFTGITEQSARAGVSADAPDNTLLTIAVTNMLRAEPGSEAATTARGNAVTILTGGGMSDADANALVDAWQQQYTETTAEMQRLTEEATENLADATAVTGGMLFLMMVLGAFAAGSGGVAGRPHRVRVLAR
jgi:hypothetical protein